MITLIWACTTSSSRWRVAAVMLKHWRWHVREWFIPGVMETLVSWVGVALKAVHCLRTLNGSMASGCARLSVVRSSRWLSLKVVRLVHFFIIVVWTFIFCNKIVFHELRHNEIVALQSNSLVHTITTWYERDIDIYSWFLSFLVIPGNIFIFSCLSL